MKPIRILFLLWTVYLTACSPYRGRMVRVQSDNPAKTQRKITVIENKEITQPIEINEPNKPTHTATLTTERITLYAAPEEVAVHLPYKMANTRVVQAEPMQDSIAKAKEDDYDLEYRRRKYRQANNYAFWALGSLLSIVATTIFGVIAALIFSILAVRIYYKYKNPGVKERFVLALSMLIISVIIILLLIGLLVLFIYF